MADTSTQCVPIGWTIATGLASLLLGYVLTRFNNKYSANRKEDRDLIDNISELISDIETQSLTYYRLPSNNEEAITIAAKIRGLIGRIGREVQHFSNTFSDKRVLGHVTILRQAVTSDLDDSSRAAYEINDPIFDNIQRHCRLLVGDLNMLFTNKYR